MYPSRLGWERLEGSPVIPNRAGMGECYWDEELGGYVFPMGEGAEGAGSIFSKVFKKLKKVAKKALPFVSMFGIGGKLTGSLFGRSFASNTIAGRFLSKGMIGAASGNLNPRMTDPMSVARLTARGVPVQYARQVRQGTMTPALAKEYGLKDIAAAKPTTTDTMLSALGVNPDDYKKVGATTANSTNPGNPYADLGPKAVNTMLDRLMGTRQPDAGGSPQDANAWAQMAQMVRDQLLGQPAGPTINAEGGGGGSGGGGTAAGPSGGETGGESPLAIDPTTGQPAGGTSYASIAVVVAGAIAAGYYAFYYKPDKPHGSN